GVLREMRSDMHARFAGWLEQRLGERSTEYDELIGYHLEQAYRDREAVLPVDAQAREFAQAASARLGGGGARAGGRGDMPAAANLLGRAASLLPAEEPARRELQLKLG